MTRVSRFELVATVVLLASCGSKQQTPEPDLVNDAGDAGMEAGAAASGPLHRSGTRLRARITDGGEGARRFDGWYDTKLKIACDFQLYDDGVRRCIPTDFFSSWPEYADPACTIPVVSWVDPKQPPRYFASAAGTASPAVACGADVDAMASMPSGDRVVSWRIGAAQPAPPTLYLRVGASCEPHPAAGFAVVHSVEQVAPSELVGVTATRVEPRGATLAVAVFENDDGSSMVGDTLFDVARKRACGASWIAGVVDDYRCYGATVPNAAGCVAGAPGSCAGDMIIERIDRCEMPTFHQLTNTGCELFDLKQFPMLASDWLGTGRIRLAITHASDDARALFVNPGLFQTYGRYKRGPFFDTERQMSCEAHVLQDGTVVCLTQNVVIATFYADAACTDLIAEKPVAMDPCPTQPAPPATEFAVDLSGRIYKVGSMVKREQVYWLNHSSDPPVCEVLPAEAARDTFDLTEADANIFARLKVETE